MALKLAFQDARTPGVVLRLYPSHQVHLVLLCQPGHQGRRLLGQSGLDHLHQTLNLREALLLYGIWVFLRRTHHQVLVHTPPRSAREGSLSIQHIVTHTVTLKRAPSLDPPPKGKRRRTDKSEDK
ncbi:hypothetical protein V6Z90_006714 [Aspergillus fumigatus]